MSCAVPACPSSSNHKRSVRTLPAQPLSYGQSMPYRPFISLLRALLDLDARDAQPDQRRQPGARLHALHPDLAADEPLLSHLLGVPQHQTGSATSPLRNGNGAFSCSATA